MKGHVIVEQDPPEDWSFMAMLSCLAEVRLVYTENDTIKLLAFFNGTIEMT